jgi:protocatechuate 3,4-dioxygenase, beta subunit
MNSKTDISRRRFFQTGLVAAAGALTASSGLAQTLGQACGLTPPQVEGPFYPEKDQLDKDNDLTFVRSGIQPAEGKRIYILGTVLDEKCAPVPRALVEIWQACASGRYNHSNDPNTTASLDPHFQYWGRSVTDAKGRYWFKTILPGSYPAAEDWVRPPHIHFKVQCLGFHELITQMYFSGNTLNRQDRILMAIPSAHRSKVVVRLEPPLPAMDPNSSLCRFNITLRHVTL